MFNLRRLLSTAVIVIIFLALASFSAVTYNGSQSSEVTQSKNPIYQKTKVVWDYLFLAAKSLAEINLNKNIGYGQKIKDEAESQLSQVDFNTLLETATSSGNISGTINDPVIAGDSVQTDEPIVNSEIGEGGEAIVISDSATTSTSTKKAGFWAGLVTQLKEEWNSTSTDEMIGQSPSTLINNLATVNPSPSDKLAEGLGLNDFLSYEKTLNGAEIIFRLKNNVEYKLPLPFKFLSAK